MLDWLLYGRHELAEPAAGDLFEETIVESELETIEEPADRSIAVLRTTSAYFRIDPSRRESFEADIRRLVERTGGGTARYSLLTFVATAVRTAQPSGA